MEEKIKQILIAKLKEYFQGYITPYKNDEIINIIVFMPFDLNIDDFNNINASDVNFNCRVKGKIEGLVSRNKGCIINFSDIKAVIKDNNIVDLDLSNVAIFFKDE